jgi:DNA-binding transcriptional LysR family regulator
MAENPPLDRTRFDWSLVRSFLAVLDAGSLMGAARRSGAQQPTLSRTFAELEGSSARRCSSAPAVAWCRPRPRWRSSTRRGRCRTAPTRSAARWPVRSARPPPARCASPPARSRPIYLLPPVLAELQRLEPGIQIELVASNADQPAAPRGRHRGAHGAAGAATRWWRARSGEIPSSPHAHRLYLACGRCAAQPAELLQHRLIGYDTRRHHERGFAGMGIAVAREQIRRAHRRPGGLRAAGGRRGRHRLRGALQRGAGRGAAAAADAAIPPLPCWLAVHREIRGSRVVRRVYDFLARALAAQLGSDNGQAPTAPAANLL